jgi:hypothetical protein
MAIDLEVKHRLRELEARIKALEERQIHPQAVRVVEEPQESKESKEPKVKLCPHCGEKPGYFFHVRSCAAKNSRAGG